MTNIATATSRMRRQGNTHSSINGDVYDKKGLNRARRGLDRAIIDESLGKAKGGNEYHHPLGDANSVLALGRAGVNDLANRLGGLVSQWDNYFDEYVINWSIVPSTIKTCHEEWGENPTVLN